MLRSCLFVIGRERFDRPSIDVDATGSLIHCRPRLEKSSELSYDEKYPIMLTGDNSLDKKSTYVQRTYVIQLPARGHYKQEICVCILHRHRPSTLASSACRLDARRGEIGS